MYLLQDKLLPSVCKDCIHCGYDSGYQGPMTPSLPSGYFCKKARIMPTKKNKCSLHKVKPTRNYSEAAGLAAFIHQTKTNLCEGVE